MKYMNVGCENEMMLGHNGWKWYLDWLLEKGKFFPKMTHDYFIATIEITIENVKLREYCYEWWDKSCINSFYGNLNKLPVMRLNIYLEIIV